MRDGSIVEIDNLTINPGERLLFPVEYIMGGHSNNPHVGPGLWDTPAPNDQDSISIVILKPNASSPYTNNDYICKMEYKSYYSGGSGMKSYCYGYYASGAEAGYEHYTTTSYVSYKFGFEISADNQTCHVLKNVVTNNQTSNSYALDYSTSNRETYDYGEQIIGP